MGLDTVDLVCAIEDEFGIDIPDIEAEQMTTVGDFYEWLKVRIATDDPVACLTQRVFYKLRRALVDNYELQRSQITPDTRLTDVLAIKEVEEGWPFLQLFIDLKTPPFKVCDQFFGFRLSDKSLTMRQLVESLIMINGRAMAPQRESEEEIWNRLKRVFIRQLNVRPNEIRPEASITRDLGAD